MRPRPSVSWPAPIRCFSASASSRHPIQGPIVMRSYSKSWGCDCLPNSLEARVRERLADWEASGLLRALRPPSGIDFSSNDYLNLATHPAIVRRLIEAAALEGCGSTGSRLLRGEREAFRAIEERVARFKGTEAALYFSSGYLANLAVLTTLAEPGDVVFSDDRNHASLID